MDMHSLAVILGAAFIWALYYRFNEALKYPVATRFLWQFMIVLPILWAAMGNIQLDKVIALQPIGWFYILLFTFFVTLGGYGFMYLSVKKIGATVTATIDYLEPLIGVILAIMIFSESFTWIQVIGWGLILISIFNVKRIKRING